jgi:hypothetical protein
MVNYSSRRVYKRSAIHQRWMTANALSTLRLLYSDNYLGKKSIAQPITFETMKRARDFVKDEIEVKLFSAQYSEDRSLVPDYMIVTKDLERSVRDISKRTGVKKLPFIKDILDRLYESSDADYLIYTNVDIALAPNFYLAVSNFINKGYDAFSINRRNIPNHFQTIEDIPKMYQEKGLPSPGHDCFVFQRDLYQQFELGEVFIGALGIGAVVSSNMIRFAKRFTCFRDEYLTFHIGNDGDWRLKNKNNVYLNKLNCKNSVKIIQNLYQSAPPNSVQKAKLKGRLKDFRFIRNKILSGFKKISNLLTRFLK